MNQIDYNKYIHEMPQRNFLYSYLKHKRSLFFLTQNQRQEGKMSPASGIGKDGSREERGKGCKRVNMVQILCTHVCNFTY
jgi:hypothetical protein